MGLLMWLMASDSSNHRSTYTISRKRNQNVVISKYFEG